MGRAILLMILSACASDPAGCFEGNRSGSSADYGVFKRETDHVATIHGFVEDLTICMRIADMLNEEEPGAFSCKPLNL